MSELLPRLAAIGTALPCGSMTSEEYADFAVRMLARVPREAALIHAIARRSGIATRYSVLADAGNGRMRLPLYEDRPDDSPRIPTTAERMVIYAREAPALALRSAQDALEQARIAPSSITHLVTASCTGFVAPGIDFEMVNGLGLNPHSPRTHIGFMGCHAALNALATARAICLANPNAIVMGVTVELCTLHFQAGLKRDDALPNALFADGAATFILAGSSSGCDGAGEWRLAQTHSCIVPDTAHLMTWRVGDTGFRMTLDASVPDVIAGNLPALASSWSWNNGAETAWGVHPGGPRILETAARVMGLREEATTASRSVLSRFGNMSSPTILYILRELLNGSGQEETMRLLAFGPGLAVEAAEFRR